MLYAKINREYIDEEAKNLIRERTLRWVHTLHPEDHKEVSITPTKLTDGLQYEFDKLFETFRASIDELLNASYNDKITYEKSYGIVKSYNVMTSFLKNAMSIGKLSLEDQEKIKGKFGDMRDKLEELKSIVESNNFVEGDDIIDMVNEINSSTTVSRKQYNPVSAKSTKMVQSIKDKNNAKAIIDDSSDKLSTIDDMIKENPFIMNNEQIAQNISNVKSFYSNINSSQLNRSEIDETIKNDKSLDTVIQQIQDEKEYHDSTKSEINDLFSRMTDLYDDLSPESIHEYGNKKYREYDKVYIDNVLMSDIQDEVDATRNQQLFLSSLVTNGGFEKEYANGKTDDLKKKMTTTVATLENLRERVIKDLDQLHIPEEVKDEVRIHVEKKPKKTKKVKPAPEAIDINRPVLEEAEFKRKVNEAVKDNRSGLDSYKTFKSREYNSAKHWKTYSSLSDDDKRSFFDLK